MLCISIRTVPGQNTHVDRQVVWVIFGIMTSLDPRHIYLRGNAKLIETNISNLYCMLKHFST